MASSVGFDAGVQKEKVQKQGRKNNYEKNVSESKVDVGLRRGVVKASKREAFSGENHVRTSCENRLRARSRYYRIRHFSGSTDEWMIANSIHEDALSALSGGSFLPGRFPHIRFSQ